MKTKTILMSVLIMLTLSSCNTTKSDIIKVGDIIQFGTYPWRVLDIQDGRALIISENIIERKQYHHNWVQTSWADCSMREYLNGEFYNSVAFSDADRERIVQITNINEDNQWYGDPAGEDTQDWIFLLSISEVVRFFGDSGQLENRPYQTGHINDQFNSNRIATYEESANSWWLRSPGGYGDLASYVGTEGFVFIIGLGVSYQLFGMRPALWVVM